jgi:hypothetical protein
MTRDPKVAERQGHGMTLNGCSKVVLEGLHIHHFSSDGIRLGIAGRGPYEPCRDVRLNQVRCTNNARQGLTNAGGIGVVATACEFSSSGRTDGPYRHAPSAGVDIEPFRRLGLKSDFRAVRCRFDENRGYPLTAIDPDRVGFVELIDCSGRNASHKRMVLKAERTVIRGGAWHNVEIACAYAAKGNSRSAISVDISGATWSGDDPSWVPVYDGSGRHPNVRIHNNRFELRSPRPFTPSHLFQCGNPNHSFEQNQISVAGSGHDGSGDDLIANFRGARLVRGNRWSTNLTPPRRFVNVYEGARVEGESFSGSFGRSG